MIQIDNIHSNIRIALESKNFGWITSTNIDKTTNQALQSIVRESITELSILKGKDTNVRYVVDSDRINYLEQLLYNFWVYDETLTDLVGECSFTNNPIEIKTLWASDNEIEIVNPSSFKRYKQNGIADEDFPIGKKVGNNKIAVLPATISSDVIADYISEPNAPLWTYATGSGKQIFTRNSHTVDVDLPSVELDNLITKILELLSVSMRSPTIEQIQQQKDLADIQLKNAN